MEENQNQDQNQNQNQNQNQTQGQDGNSSSPRNSSERSEPVRSRWTPKPEQILILESIFNSGMVNPPKDETVRIRKLLEKFGSVGDANVFYWFQNRRSRSRRRQRQIQASLAEEQIRIQAQTQQAQHAASSIQYDPLCSPTDSTVGFPLCCSVSPSSYVVGPSSSSSSSSSSTCSSSGVIQDGHVDNNLFQIPPQLGFQEFEQASSISSILCSSDTSNLHYQPGFITVFINGVPTEVPRGPLDMKAMFGQDVLIVHSSGVPLPTNEFGFLIQSLQHGESYFLVSRPT